MKLHSDRHKQAKCRGYQARIDGKPKSDNYYTGLGKFGQVYSSVWDAGWEEANNKISSLVTTII